MRDKGSEQVGYLQSYLSVLKITYLQDPNTNSGLEDRLSSRPEFVARCRVILCCSWLRTITAIKIYIQSVGFVGDDGLAMSAKGTSPNHHLGLASVSMKNIAAKLE